MSGSERGVSRRLEGTERVTKRCPDGATFEWKEPFKGKEAFKRA